MNSGIYVFRLGPRHPSAPRPERHPSATRAPRAPNCGTRDRARSARAPPGVGHRARTHGFNIACAISLCCARFFVARANLTLRSRETAVRARRTVPGRSRTVPERHRTTPDKPQNVPDRVENVPEQPTEWSRRPPECSRTTPELIRTTPECSRTTPESPQNAPERHQNALERFPECSRMPPDRCSWRASFFFVPCCLPEGEPTSCHWLLRNWPLLGPRIGDQKQYAFWIHMKGLHS